MSDKTEIVERDQERDADVTAPKQRGIPFKPGVSGNPAGRPKGARSKFSEAFIADIATVWEARGTEVLVKCAEEEPGTFLRVCASLMPKDVNLSVGFDARSTLESFRAAVRSLGNEPPAALPRPLKVIDGSS